MTETINLNVRMNLSQVHRTYEGMRMIYSATPTQHRQSKDRMLIWQKWGWLMAMNLARFIPMTGANQIDKMDEVIRKKTRKMASVKAMWSRCIRLRRIWGW